MEKHKNAYILWFKDITYKDISLVGGKNASLGEMYSNLSKKGINVPNGFAITSNAYWRYLEHNNLLEKLKKVFLSYKKGDVKSLRETGKKARSLIMKGEIPEDLKKEIIRAYKELSVQYKQKFTDVAVRSSATAEDLPTASFAGQFETFLNVKGEKELIDTVKKCFASMFTDRVISYREEHNFSHFDVAISVGVQKMVRSDKACSGVMFTLDTETGFKNVVLINGIWGLGENIVKGRVIPDEFIVFKETLKKGFKPIVDKKLGFKDKKLIYKGVGVKEISTSKKEKESFVLNDEEILTLAKYAVAIEDYYSKKNGKWIPQDIEWAKDGITKELFIVQARPETVHSQQKVLSYKEYKIESKRAKVLLKGISVGEKVAYGRARVIKNINKITEFKEGEILVIPLTTPDWEPVMKKAAGIITDRGGRTSHAAIVSRELGVPAIVGTQYATQKIKTGDIVTLDCTSYEGKVLKGKVKFSVKEYKIDRIPKMKTNIMVNIGEPDLAFKYSFLPVKGVGLAREEFIIAEKIKVHPLALVNSKKGKEFFVDNLAMGIGKIACAFYPKEVIVRFSDFKTNEYRKLKYGEKFEQIEENPMLGFRGASRYYDKSFRKAFEMECLAIKKVIDDFGLNNVSVMIPFCRTPEEGAKVLDIMKQFGLFKGKLKVYVMCEIPSNVLLAKDYLKIFDGMSIGSNDLSQLVLGMDRDNSKIAHIADERNEAVKIMIKQVIKVCKENNKYVGICGQAPSTFLDFAKFLVEEGIDSISLNPDAVLKFMFSFK